MKLLFSFIFKSTIPWMIFSMILMKNRKVRILWTKSWMKLVLKYLERYEEIISHCSWKVICPRPYIFIDFCSAFLFVSVFYHFDYCVSSCLPKCNFSSFFFLIDGQGSFNCQRHAICISIPKCHNFWWRDWAAAQSPGSRLTPWWRAACLLQLLQCWHAHECARPVSIKTKFLCKILPEPSLVTMNSRSSWNN